MKFCHLWWYQYFVWPMDYNIIITNSVLTNIELINKYTLTINRGGEVLHVHDTKHIKGGNILQFILRIYYILFH